MFVSTFNDAHEFSQKATPFLVVAEAAHCLPLGMICRLCESPPAPDAGVLMLLATDDQGDVCGLALRTPPHNLVYCGESNVAAPIAHCLQQQGSQLRGVTGPTGAATRFAEHWHKTTGAGFILEREMRIFECDCVIDPLPAPGHCRPATQEDGVELFIAWTHSFSDETATEGPEAEVLVKRLLAQGALYVWEDAGCIVSMAAHSGSTPNGIRVNLVYTPPEHRGHGYANCCVAAMTKVLLAERAFCFLFTDLSNATTNRIYPAIGYQAVCDWRMIRFEGAGR